MALKKLLYIANLRLPTEKAYGIQIAKMCEAFASSATINNQQSTINSGNIKVELVAPHRGNDIKDNLFDYYSVKRNFKFKKIWAPDFYPPKFLEQKFGRVYFCERGAKYKKYFVFCPSEAKRSEYSAACSVSRGGAKSDLAKPPLDTSRLAARSIHFPGKLDRASVLLKDFISGARLALYALLSDADIIYSRDEWPIYLLSFFNPTLTRKCGIIYEAHRFSEHRTLFYKRFKNKNLKIVVITKRLKEDFIKIGFKPENILVAPDGVDLEEFNINISKEEARARVGLPPNVKIVMYTGHLFEWKGANTLLETAKSITNYQLPITNSGILFVFIGGTDYEIEKFKEKAKGLENVLIAGYKPHKEIPIYLKAADVLVLPNSAKDKISSYTSPLKLFEYMASGRPIIASSLSSIMEILNKENSVLVPPDDPAGLAGGIKVILDDSTLGEKLSKKSSENVEQYTWEKRAQNIINFNRVD